ncbi:VOC family protein [Sphaerisporangium siamense]|uniref:PhnB protein n=1 Tax=Sphaerisporangium siamense TaxID=795645 RepID=A0A7W7GG59_9ACTN|nr:VOC family protein [Sphaerisporangium siamense]MBB4705746.1 PhnB protein [Sphaerisporangium siamense]GII82869.1 VOC family protein [Sphaerisporangium siamense]
MASLLNPYLNFPGTARQAMEFYESVFGGTLSVNTFGDFGAPDTELADKIMHSTLETRGGFTLMASDLPPDMEYTPGTNISVSLSGEDADELRDYWEKLSAGGLVTVPLERQMWGDEFGSCVDRFGIPWMVDITAPRT